MRYAITYSTSSGVLAWDNTDTMIVESDLCPYGWEKGDLVKLFEARGFTTAQAWGIIEPKLYFVRNCDDIDYYKEDNNGD